MRLAPIKTRVPLGSSIRVTLYAGESLDGTLLDIDDECLVISADDSEVILEATAIAMVKRLFQGADEASGDISALGGPLPQRQGHSVQGAVFPAAATETLAHLERRVRATSLQIPGPEWTVFDEDLDAEARAHLRRELLALRNRYLYAIKTKEEDRILQCVSGLRKFAEDYRAQEALQTAGRILWQLGRREQARDLFAEAADALNDSLSCFDLAMAQRLTDEGEYAPSTLRNCLNESSSPHAIALMALTAIVLSEDSGQAELAGLVRDAGAWQSGPARLAVLHCGLICVSPGDLEEFPIEQWDSPDADPDAFELLARAVHATPASAASRDFSTTQSKASQSEGSAIREAFSPDQVTPTITPGTTPSGEGAPAPTVKDLAVAVHACLNRRDISGAEQAFAELKALAPLDSLTWQAGRALSNARNSAPRATKGPSPAGVPAARKTAVKTTATSIRGNGPLARAEDAFRREDYEQAQQLFEQAIAQGDQPVRAVRRLVTLLSHRLKRREEALTVLATHKHLFRTDAELWGWSQDRSTVLEHAGRWQEAEEELRRMLSSAPTKDDRVKIVKRMTAALLKINRPQDAKHLLQEELRRGPRQQSLESILRQLNRALETGTFNQVEATLQLQAEPTSELSPLLAFHLERCEYWGVRAESLARREFTEDDFKRLDSLISNRPQRHGLGKQFPRERAEANLSAARIMQDLGITDDGFRKRLRDFAAAMGDACALEQRGNVDVIRAYYTEAVSVKGDWDSTVEVKLRQLVTSFTQGDVRLLDIDSLPPLEQGLASVMRHKHLTAKVLVALLSLPTQGETALRLIRMVWLNHAARSLFQEALTHHLSREVSADEANFTEAWLQAAELDRNRRKIYRQITDLAESGPALTSLDRHSAELNRIYQEMQDLASPTDQRRITSCREIINDLRQYVAQSAYVERERLFGVVRTAIRGTVTEFENAPTVVSVEILLPYLAVLGQEIEKDFQQYAAKAAPENLKVELVVDRYLASNGEVTIQLQVSNGMDASPVSNVELEVVHTADYTTAKGIVPVAESIGAGESRTCQISLAATPSAIEQELITLHSRVHFTLRSGKRVTGSVERESIRLHADTEWVEIPNLYAAGLPVKDRRMFKGREQLIGELVDTVGDSRGSVVVFGQKRAGKSSVLFHLKEAFTSPHLAVSFSIQDLAGTVNFADMLYAIASEFHQTLSERVEDDELPVEPPPAPDILQIRLAELPKFIEYMRGLQRWLKSAPGLADSNLVLLIDEFSVIHKEIRVGNLPTDFMKGWKALLEKGFFRCVVVGNDLMPRFIQDYPNEFQVALQKRVSYLDEIYARQLIEDPIRLPDGASRYRGNAVDLILALTGRSPYYIQLFCHELVQYMNREDVRAPHIGPADVDTVTKKLITELNKNQFDNLLTPGDSEVTDISETLVMDVLRATRRESGPYMYHEINTEAHPESERVIEDLLRREVLWRLPGDRYRIQVGLFSEWLQHQWA